MADGPRVHRGRTRREFEEWAAAAASTHGYEVEMDGLGTAVDEDAALAAEPVLQDVGFSTQVCRLGLCPCT